MSPRVSVSKEFGPLLIGREVGRAIRTRHFDVEPGAWPESVDFHGVIQATESCLDELFGELAREHGLDAVRRLPVPGMTPVIKEAADYVLDLVEHPPEDATAQAIASILKPHPLTRTAKARKKVTLTVRRTVAVRGKLRVRRKLAGGKTLTSARKVAVRKK